MSFFGTRCQIWGTIELHRDPISKVLSGKNVSKHPMLSISLAYNVISCKKIKRNTKKQGQNSPAANFLPKGVCSPMYTGLFTFMAHWPIPISLFVFE